MIGGLLASPGPEPRKPSRLVFCLAAAAGPLILLALTLWVDDEYHRIEIVRSQVRTSFERQIAAANLLGALTAAESAQRGYIVTGDPAFLSRYRAAQAQVADDLSRLEPSAATDEGEAGTVARLRVLVGEREAETARVIDLRRREGFAAASARVSGGQGTVLMDRVRGMIADRSRAQATELRHRQHFLIQGSAHLEELLRGMMLLVALLLLAGAGTFWQLRMRRYRSERDAHDTATLLREVFAGNADATLLLDLDGAIQAANAAAVRLFGYSYDEMVGRDVLGLFEVGGEGDFGTRIGLVAERLARPYWLDVAMRHRDGHDVAVDIALGSMALPGATYVIATIRDIGERKTIERIKDEFLANVSHELRTPLTSVVGALGLLRGAPVGAMPHNAQRLIDIAENNSRRLIRLVNDLLDIDRIGSGRMRFDRVRFDLVDAAHAAIEGARGLADVRAIHVELAADEQPVIVDGDHDRLLQVLANLLSNAIRASPAEGSVLVSVERQGGRAVVSVEDGGCGISPELATRIFERFAQAVDAPTGGSGLGLAISREIVVAHEGRIWFEDLPGGGARFAFSLPAAPEQQPLRGSRPCILVGVADSEIAERLSQMLETEGCAVECVGTDAQVQEIAGTGRYDVLVLDSALPDVGGVETARALHRCAETHKLPTIIMSSAVSADRAEAGGTASEPIDWIERPVEAKALAAAVRRALERSAAIRPTLLHIDGDPDMLEVAAAVLAEHGRIVHATSVASARAVLATHAFDLVILDPSLPDGSGSALLADLVHRDGSAIPTIIYSTTDVPPELEKRVDAVLVKSRRSLGSLARAIQRILASVDDDTNRV
jgi:PAS domain S-box-containing protein